jgi:D-alanine-D-alanine ligase
MKKKTNVGILFGGKSGEHEVSLMSAKSVYEAIDKEKYNVTLIGIDKEGQWHIGEQSKILLNDTNPKLISLNKETAKVTAIATNKSTNLIEQNSNTNLGSVDVFIPLTHGTFGEDGCIQGMLELLNSAYVGSGVLGSAVGMDKDVMKRLLHEANITIGNFIPIKKSQYKEENLRRLTSILGGFPIFVKPANTGSSVGVHKANNEKELKEAIKDAFQYDSKILLEEYIEGREIEISVLGNDNPIASLPGEIISSHEFYSYEAKYIDENGAELKIPAELTELQVKHIQNVAISAFQILECSGLARVDFFLTEAGELYLNEINTLPGFTKISMYPKLWEATGISYPELIDRLIQLAIEQKEKKDSLKRHYTA